MIYAVDFNNTITDNPVFFKTISRDGKLYVVSGTCKKERKFVESYLKKYQIKYLKLFLCPFKWTCPEEYHQAKEWKVKTIRKLKPDIYFDDSLREILTIQKNSKTLGMLMIKSSYRKWMRR